MVDIILRKPSSLYPIIHPLPAERDIHRLFLEVDNRRDDVIAALARFHEENGVEGSFRDAVEAIPTRYEPSCIVRCGFGRQCRARAKEESDPAAIDGGAISLLGNSLDVLLNPHDLGDSYEERLIKNALDAIDEAIL